MTYSDTNHVTHRGTNYVTTRHVVHSDTNHLTTYGGTNHVI